MSNYTNSLNELINTKKELKDIIIESTGENPSEVFSYYPSYIRSAIAAGGGSASEEAVNSYISAYLSTYNFIDQTKLSSNSYITMGDVSACGYITGSDVAQMGYITANDVDLSDYVTYSYAYNTFVSYSYLGDIEEITEYILGSGSSSAPENIYATKAELNSYATKTELGAYVSKISLQNMAYITMDDVSACGYITVNDISIPVINENLIPKASDTYTLGDSSHLYSTTYTNNIFMDGHSITYRNSTSILFSIANRDNFIMLSSAFCPSRVGMNLGMDYVSNKWNSTYTANIYADNAYISNYNNLIWTGTSAEYALLDNYTTYQIYMIKEA